MSALLSLYHRLPAPLRTLVASARGYHLRMWRYGLDHEEQVAAALERDRWTEARWQADRDTRLEQLLHRAATQVPFYRDLWTARRRAGDRRSWSDLASWPVLTKDQLRASPLAFVADDRDPRRMFGEHTSGTTGKPLQLWFTRASLRAYYAIYEARVRRWAGVTRGDRWANIGGQQIVPFRQSRPPFWVWNAGLHQLYLSSYHLSAEFVPHYLKALRDYEIRYVLGYSSSLHALAELALANGIPCPTFTAMTSNAEPLYAFQRDAISKAFHTRVRETYGMSELACSASECEHGTLHLWPDVGIVEILDDDGDAPTPPGSTGRIICTGLVNHDMPLIRYQVGDRGTLAAPNARCECGRALPILRAVEGRIDDVLITEDGRRIGRLDPIFKSDLPIHEAQIIQESLRRVRIKVVAAPGYIAAHGTTLAGNLRERMGDVEVVIELVTEIPRTAAGKFRAVVNQMNVT